MLSFKEYLEVTDPAIYLDEAYMPATISTAPFEKQELGWARQKTSHSVSRSDAGLQATVQMVKNILKKTRSLRAVTNRLRSLGLSPGILSAVIDGVAEIYPKAADKIKMAMGV